MNSVQKKKKYLGIFKSYFMHCQHNDKNTFYFAMIQFLKLWIIWLINNNTFAKTIKTRLCKLKTWQTNIEWQNIKTFEHFALKNIITNVKKIQNKSNKQLKKFIIQKIFIKLLKYYDQNNEYHVNIWMIWCLIFAIFLKIREFTYSNFKKKVSDFHCWHLTNKSVQMKTNKMTISLPINMTNPFRTKIFLTIAKTNDETCLMIVMKYLLNWFFALSNEPFFQNENELFDKKMMNSVMKKKMIHWNHLKIEQKYSFHQNVEISVKTIELPREEMQTLKQQNSKTYKIYVNNNFTQFFERFKLFQRACSKVAWNKQKKWWSNMNLLII